MEGEGLALPELPVVYIKAKDEADAKEILLKISSQYGKVSQKGFEDFIKGLDIDFEDLGINVQPPGNIREELGNIPENARPEALSLAGDLYTIGPHKLICGDSARPETYKRLMENEKADMVFTDPPYGVSIGDKGKLLNEKHNGGKIGKGSIEINIENDTLNSENLKQLLTDIFSVMLHFMKDDAAYYITSPPGFNQIIIFTALETARLPVKQVLVWCKNQATFSLKRLNYDYQHEGILYGWNKTHNFYGNGKYSSSLWHYNKPLKNDLHPTMKPPALIQNAIENSMEPLEKTENALLNSSVKNDIILDVFGGSGSTLIAAQDCKRRARLIEIDPWYCDVIVKRAMDAYPALKVTRERNGETRSVESGFFDYNSIRTVEKTDKTDSRRGSS
jgi:DNA modification methylase